MNVGPVVYATMGQLVYPHMKAQGGLTLIGLFQSSPPIARPWPPRW